MKANFRYTLVYITLSIALLLWVGVGLASSASSWLEPASPPSLKMDAFEEIALTAGVLNVALPLAILFVLIRFVLAKKKVIPLILPFVTLIFLTGITIPTISLWRQMDEVHGLSISLTRTHLWWGK